jgi:23S rRNA (guanosine2251-2'-O)-methyltransferase
MLIFGIHAVAEALRAGTVSAIRVAHRSGRRLVSLVSAAEHRGVPVQRVSDADLDRAAGGGVHQGIVADVRERTHTSLDRLVAHAGGPPLLVVLDGVQDPQNVGAILRTVDAAGGHGVVRQSRHAAPLGSGVARASAGALAHVPVADVINIARAIEELKELGVWTVGFAADAPAAYDEIDYTRPTAIVVGSESTGLRRLVRDRCDWIVSIPLAGHVQSLNVSVATAVALYEAVRQRRHQTTASDDGTGTASGRHRGG